MVASRLITHTRQSKNINYNSKSCSKKSSINKFIRIPTASGYAYHIKTGSLWCPPHKNYRPNTGSYENYLLQINSLINPTGLFPQPTITQCHSYHDPNPCIDRTHQVYPHLDSTGNYHSSHFCSAVPHRPW